MLRQFLVVALVVTALSLLPVLTSEAGTILVFESTSHPTKGIKLVACVFILLLLEGLKVAVERGSGNEILCF